MHLDPALPRAHLKAQCDILQKFRHDKGLELRRDGAGFKFGEFEQGIDQSARADRSGAGRR